MAATISQFRVHVAPFTAVKLHWHLCFLVTQGSSDGPKMAYLRTCVAILRLDIRQHTAKDPLFDIRHLRRQTGLRNKIKGSTVLMEASSGIRYTPDIADVQIVWARAYKEGYIMHVYITLYKVSCLPYASAIR